MTVSNAGGYTSTAVRAIGANPMYVDIEQSDHLMSLRTFEAAIASTARTPKALVVTHLYGSAVDINPIAERARALGIAIIEDCAQALGARRDGRMVGTLGDIATTSFYPTKNLGAIGDAGALFTSQPQLAATVRRLRQYGWESKYCTTTPGGMNSRMDEMQAAIVRVKLPHLDSFNQRRNAIHERYEAAASEDIRFVTSSVPGFIGHLAVIETDDREDLRRRLDKAGIATDVHYPIPDHLQPLVGAGAPQLAVTEHAAQHILTVPLFPELRDDEIQRVSDALSLA